METVFGAILEKALIIYAPELGAPVVKQIVDFAETSVEDYLTKYIETGATFLVIDVQTGLETTAMGKALADLKRAEASGDPAAIAAAQDEYDQAESALVNDDGSAKPQ